MSALPLLSPSHFHWHSGINPEASITAFVLPLGASPTFATKSNDRLVRVSQMAYNSPPLCTPTSDYRLILPGTGETAKPGLNESPGSFCVFKEQALGFLPELDSG